jgi:hypothetical protein
MTLGLQLVERQPIWSHAAAVAVSLVRVLSWTDTDSRTKLYQCNVNRCFGRDCTSNKNFMNFFFPHFLHDFRFRKVSYTNTLLLRNNLDFRDFDLS